MAIRDEESMSDGLEILSIGRLYSGPWDKKYWSSSRGKDRYPYPVGYQAIRTLKGHTYKMEVYEGPKGPVFQITLNNKQSGSGNTPDRAWEDFRKKCSSGIKLWHAKRFSGKVDGVEFFGFKNVLVQRLLRELVAAVNDASELSSSCKSFNEASVESSAKGYNVTDKCPDLVVYFRKNQVTGKRTRACRGRDKKSTSKSRPGRCQSQQQDGDTKVLDPVPLKTGNELMASCASNIGLEGGTLPVSSDVGPVKNGLLPALAFEASDDTKVEPCLTQVQRELPSMEICISASFVNFDIPQEEKSLDRQCVEVQQHGYPVMIEDKNEKAQAAGDSLDSKAPGLNDSQGYHGGDLCAPDTFDAQQEITTPPDSGNHEVENFVTRNEVAGADMIMSDGTIAGSRSEEGNSYLDGNSERGDFDSVGEEAANSMMTLLLPRAVPLLTYSSRKKKRKTKSLKGSSCEQKLENRLKEAAPCVDLMSPVGAPADSSLKGPTNTNISGVCINAPTSLLENISCIVPDSLDDQFDSQVANQLLTPDNAEAVMSDSQKGGHQPEIKGSYAKIVANETFDSLNGLNKISSLEEQKDFDKEPQKCCLPELCPSDSCGPLLKDDCLVADEGFKSLEVFSKKPEPEVAATCKGLNMMLESDKRQSIPCNPLQDPSEVVAHVMEKYSAPLSEIIIFRNPGETGLLETCHANGNMDAPESYPLTSLSNGDMGKISYIVEGGQGGHIPLVQNEENHEALAMKSADGSLDVGNSEMWNGQDTTANENCESVICPLDKASIPSANSAPNVVESPIDIQGNPPQKEKHTDAVDSPWKRIGCYSHPVPISSVILTRKAHDIYVAVTCGLSEERKRDMFLYKIDAEECGLGTPCMVAYTSMHLPILKDEFGRQVAVDKTGLQFTPDATGLVMVDSIRTPYCRENIDCLCPQCESCCFEDNGIKIVQVKHGYVSVVLRLKTIHPLHLILVCEPEHLIALDEGGIIYIWVMNSTWSEQSEEYVIPSNELLPSRIIELKRIPRSASMVIGHNGYGEFSLWDIKKQTVLSRFSASTNSVLEFVPVSLFSWQTKSPESHSKPIKDECVKKIAEASMLCFSTHNEANMSCQMEGKDIGVWLFTSASDNQVQSCSSSHLVGPNGSWRLGLLIKNKMIFGVSLPPSTRAIGTAAGHGIVGTDKGHVYIWDLASRNKLTTLHDFAVSDGEVSQIVSDYSTSSAIAIARDAQLCVYLRT